MRLAKVFTIPQSPGIDKELERKDSAMDEFKDGKARAWAIVACVMAFIAMALAVKANAGTTVTYEWDHPVVTEANPSPDWYVIEYSDNALATWARVDTIPATLNQWTHAEAEGRISLRVTGARVVSAGGGELWIEGETSLASPVLDVRPPGVPGMPNIFYVVAGAILVGLFVVMVVNRRDSV